MGNDCFPCSASVVDCTKPSQKAFKKKASFGATGGHAARGQGCFFFVAKVLPQLLSHARSQVLHRACEGAWFHVAVNIGAE